jgi:hypothetical protein
MEPADKIVGDNNSDSFEIEGELKLIKGFFSSSRNIYRLKYPYILVGKQVKANKRQLQFVIRYDLTMYQV